MGELVDKVRDAGIVGAGGAGFPTHVKYQATVEYVIANGAECEPLLYCDQALMVRKSHEMVEGLERAMKEVKAHTGFIALKRKYTDAVSSLESAISGKSNIHLHLMDSFYPAGDEQVIVWEVLGRVVPEGGLPLQVGVVVNNVGTLVNVAAAWKGESVTMRWLTVHGDVRRPSTFEVPIGTSIKDALSLAGGATVDDFKVIIGGPMMGVVAESLDTPVTKTTSGLIVLSSDHHHIQRKLFDPNGILRRGKASCDQCMYCTDLCPRYLLGHNLKPHMMMRALPYGLSDSDIVTSAFLCCECGVCTYYACPLFLSPGLINAYMKKEMGRKNIKNPHRRSELTPFVYRNERRVPTERLIERLGLSKYHYHAPVVEPDFIPGRVRIPLKQHLGAPAAPVVKEGDRVKRGQLIGEIPSGSLSARVHASIPGYVMSVGEDVVIEA